MNKLVKIIQYSLLGLFLLFTLAVIALESGPGRAFVRRLVIDAIELSGVKLDTLEFQGRLPQELEVKNVSIKGIEGRDIFVEKVHIKLALLNLLKGELCARSVEGEGVTITPDSAVPPVRFSNKGLPFSIKVKSFTLKRVTLPEEIELRGRFKLTRRNRTLLIDTAITRPSFPDAKMEVLVMKRRFGELELHVSLDTPTLRPLQPWIEFHSEGPLTLSFFAKGSLDAYSGKFDGKFDAKTLPLPSPLDKVVERDWTFRGKLQKRKEKPLELRNLLASSKHLRLKGALDFTNRFAVAKGRIQVQAELAQVIDPHVKGRLSALSTIELTEEGLNINATWSVPSLGFQHLKAEEMKGRFEGKVSEKALLGSIELSTQFLSEPWTIKTPIAYRPKSALYFEQISIDSPLLTAKGNLAYRTDGFWIGKVEVDQMNLHLVSHAFPHVELYGNGTGLFSSSVIEQMQAFHAELKAQEIYLSSAYAKEADIQLDWREDVKGKISLDLANLKYEQLFLDALHLHTSSTDQSWPFQLQFDGTLRDPLHGMIEGEWKYQNKTFSASLNGSTTLLNYGVTLSNPVFIEWNEETQKIKNLAGSVGSGSFFFDWESDPLETDAKLLFNQVPLDFLSLNSLEVGVEGNLTLDTTLRERNNRVQGEVHATIEGLEVKVKGELDPLMAHGNFDATFNRDTLELKGGLEVRDAPLLTVDLALPIHFELRPLAAKFLLNKPASGHLSMEGRLEDVLDFFDFGTHRFEGDATCDLTLKNTLGSPRLEGYCEIENGLYQNYLTGTELINLRADILAEQDVLYLRSLTGQDGKNKGNLKATGELQLKAAKKFPFRADVAFERLNVVEIDFITSEAEGAITIQGDLDSALAKGKIKVLETDMTIPDRLSRQLPELQVIYKNAPKPITYTAPHLDSPYPLYLDLQVQAPDGIFIGGRGLQSEWKGDFQIGGTFTSIAPKGKLELVTGEFVFAGKTFKLSDGAVSLSGKEREMPHLDISGNMAEKGVSITARLRGPINQPQLTFHSIPPLPLSGILSYLLFGQDLSEIDGFQALQLASTIAALAGEGPDVLENTRKSLGIDRLRIISTPTADDGDVLALQVGKYVAKGVLVSISQGAENSSTNISIEVDIGAGFFFEAASDQSQEQGKFSLKWNRNY